MNRMIRKCLGVLLVLAMILAMVPAVAPVEAQAATVSNAQKMQNGVTLHAWNWSFKNIEANMAKIASLGYTSIQVPPIQTAKQTTAGYSMSDWWVYYQPADFAIDNTGRSALGNKAQFESMCKEAHKYGISVIVDVVANHMADNGSNKLHSAVNADLRNDSSCWHDISKNISNYNDRYNITQYCLDGVPDLNTSNKKVQNYVLNYLKECVDAGADGFRFDAVKHIETPDDTYCSSDFWPTVINGIKKYDPDVYLYGELLYHPDDSNSISDKIYTKYFSVTDNSWSNSIRNNVVCGGNAGAFSYSYHKDAEANQLVLWAESHDTYAGNDNSDDVSIQNINKTWALVAARADAMSLYLARPQNLYPQKLGEVTKGGWDAPEVAAVNKFHNAFAGQGEYVSNQNNIAYVERGNSGVVLVNCGGTSGSVSVTANAMANGTYKDQITGNTFTVANGKITGTIGSTGIAVVYNATACAHKSHTQAGLCSECYAQVGHTYVSGVCACGKVQPVDRVIYFTNSGNWSKVNIYAWNDAGTQAGEWPGAAMTKTADGKYTFTLSGEAENVIFNNGTDQTDDLDLPALSTGYNHYDFTSGKWSFYDDGTSCAHTSHGTDGKCTACGVTVGHTFVGGICACGATKPVEGLDYYLIGNINGEDHGDGDDYANLGDYSFKNGPITVAFTETSYVCVKNAANTTWYMTNGWQGEVTSVTLYDTAKLDTTADKLMIPGGVTVTISLEENADGTLTLSYSTDGTIPDLPDDPDCTHTSHDKDGKCTACGVTVGHTFVGGICACGATKPVEGLDYYLIGNINGEDHGDGDDYANLGDYSFKNGPITVAFTETSYVCVKNAANTTWYMTDGWQGEVTSVKLYKTADLDTTADKLMIPGGVTVTISLEENADGTLTLSYSTDGTIPDLPDIPDIPDDPTQKTVYFDNTAGWDTVNIYYWSDANNAMIGWPGTAMTKVEGNIYSFTLPADAEYVIFNDGTTQTDDLTIPEDKNLYSYATGNWTDYTPPQPVTIYFQNTAGWSTPYIYAWSDAGEFVGTWPGLPMSPVAGQAGLYSFSLSSSATQVIFHNNEGLQTDDLTIPTDGKNLYTYNTDSWSVYQVCTHKAHDDQGICTGCGKNVGHNWVSGKCDGCGGQQVSITRQPVSVTVAAGAQAKVTFTAIGDGLTYKWYYKNKGASAFSLTKTFGGNTYTAEMNATRDGRRIYCVITDKYGNSVTTDTVTISMKTPLAITKQPVSVSVNAGAKATVTVGATGDGLTYKWYYANKGSNKFIVTTAFTGSSYSLSMTAARDGRRIYCVITDKYGNSVTTDTVTISMKSSLVITAQPQNVTVVSGAQAKVTVSAQGEGLTYKWYYANKGSNKFLLTNTFKGNTYTAEMNATRDGRRIYCVITDKYGNSVTTDTVTLSMKSSLVITGQPQSITVAAGAQAKITVSVQGEGLTYKWYYANKGSNKFLLTNTFKGNTYTAEMNATRDGRRVYCVITDKYGSSVTTDTVTISMKSGVTITKQPVSVAVAAGAQAKVTVSAQGEGLTYQWFYADAGSDTFKLTTAFKGNSYNVSMTAARNGRRIYCVITDANGNSVTTEIVTISMK